MAGHRYIPMLVSSVNPNTAFALDAVTRLAMGSASLYNVLASQTQVETLRQKYLAGGYGYGQAKQALWELILEQFKTERYRFQSYLQDVSYVEQQLAIGEEKARSIAAHTLEKIRARPHVLADTRTFELFGPRKNNPGAVKESLVQ